MFAAVVLGVPFAAIETPHGSVLSTPWTGITISVQGVASWIAIIVRMDSVDHGGKSLEMIVVLYVQ